MIWALIFRVIGNPLGVAVIGVVASFAAFHTGKVIGHAQGVAEQEAAQAAADAEASAEIRERVQNALREIGVRHTDDDVDSILRGLASE